MRTGFTAIGQLQRSDFVVDFNPFAEAGGVVVAAMKGSIMKHVVIGGRAHRDQAGTPDGGAGSRR